MVSSVNGPVRASTLRSRDGVTTGGADDERIRVEGRAHALDGRRAVAVVAVELEPSSSACSRRSDRSSSVIASRLIAPDRSSTRNPAASSWLATSAKIMLGVLFAPWFKAVP